MTTRYEPEGPSGVTLDGQKESLVRVCEDVVQCYAKNKEDELVNSSFLLFGETVPLLEDEVNLMRVRTFNKYEEYIKPQAVSTHLIEPTHFISIPYARVVETSDVKSPYKMCLRMSSLVRVIGHEDRGTGSHVHLEGAGWTWAGAVREIGDWFPDFVEVMYELRHGFYGHGERGGLFADCSSILQAACAVSGIPCPRIANAQAAEFGEAVPLSYLHGKLRRGDAIFWNGHVAVMVDQFTAIHMTEYRMGFVEEPLADIIARRRLFEPLGKSEIVAIRRLPGYRYDP